jgi:hypothetical protein
MNISRPRLRLPSPALIISCVALFSALGGGAYAATSLSNSTVTWHNASYQHGWGLFGAGYAPAGYAKDSTGVVHLRGGISGGSGCAFTLPAGDRPIHDLYLPIYTDGATEGSLHVYANGCVDPFGTDATAYSGLDGVSFAAGE